jgi:hypothetical protein
MSWYVVRFPDGETLNHGALVATLAEAVKDFGTPKSVSVCAAGGLPPVVPVNVSDDELRLRSSLAGTTDIVSLPIRLPMDSVNHTFPSRPMVIAPRSVQDCN